MNSDLLKRVLEIVKKTGDKFVIADEVSGGAYVVMDLADYEKLIFSHKSKVTTPDPSLLRRGDRELVKDLTEEEILGRINQEIRSWQDEKVKEVSVSDEVAAAGKSDLEEEEKYYLEPLE